MMRTLLRKQMMEVFSWLYKNKKSGKLRTAKEIAGYVLLYLLLFGFIGVMFGMGADYICMPLLEAGMGWLYWCLMGLVAIFFGVFGSVFNTYSSLYQAKDNDLLLSMPIPVSRILMVRLSGVYAMGLMYELIVIIPTVIVWFINAPFTLLGTVNTLLIPFVLSLFVLVLSAVLGWVVAAVMTKIKHKNIITVIISLIFISAYYYVYSKAFSIMQTILQNLETVGSKLKTVLYPFYHMGLAAEGNALSMLFFTAIVIALTALTYLILSGSFLKLATVNRGAAKTVYREQTVKAGSVNKALLHKEFLRFTGSANYMLNCGLGIILMPLAAIFLIWKAGLVREFLAMDIFGEYLPLLAVGIICLVASINDMTASSVSLEGKNLWIAQSFPVSGRQALLAKLNLHLILTVIPAIPLVIVVEWLLKPKAVYAIFMPVAVVLFIVLMALLGLVLNLKWPNIHWSSEIVPIKQSAPVMIALFGGWIIIVILAVSYVLLKGILSIPMYFSFLCVLLLALCAVMLRWLLTRGAEIFETLQ